MIEVRFFAAAREAAGTSSEVRHEATVGELKSALVRDHPRLGPILGHCAVLVDGTRREDTHRLDGGGQDQIGPVDVLPPFAGG
ncbi:MoaD/ThiS family protein [Aeromicrobium alkaliterrae]|uniref:MoaD/ThiS family protein n=1 Tax=Aeromicrobium alkaliterrae TaxID=302168 RepID=A0ABN2JLR1_9ACTN